MSTFLTLERLNGGNVQCTHKVDAVEPGDPAAWGIILADAIRHIARARSQQYGDSEWTVIDRIVEVLVDEIEFQRDDPSRSQISGGITQ